MRSDHLAPLIPAKAGILKIYSLSRLRGVGGEWCGHKRSEWNLVVHIVVFAAGGSHHGPPLA